MRCCKDIKYMSNAYCVTKWLRPCAAVLPKRLPIRTHNLFNRLFFWQVVFALRKQTVFSQLRNRKRLRKRKRRKKQEGKSPPIKQIRGFLFFARLFATRRCAWSYVPNLATTCTCSYVVYVNNNVGEVSVKSSVERVQNSKKHKMC